MREEIVARLRREAKEWEFAEEGDVGYWPVHLALSAAADEIEALRTLLRSVRLDLIAIATTAPTRNLSSMARAAEERIDANLPALAALDATVPTREETT